MSQKEMVEEDVKVLDVNTVRCRLSLER